MTKRERRTRIIGLANIRYGRDCEIEFDEDAGISEGDENGAYVQAWVWVDFAGTLLDKEVGGVRRVK